MSSQPHAPFLQSVLRGLKGRCPHCAEGRLFWRYLKVEPHCQACGHDLARYPADDGPAYFTILIVGHLIIAPALFFPFIWEAPPAIVLPTVLIPLGAATLALLHVVKGGFVGAMYALGVKDSDAKLHTADVADPR
ncbi:MAG: DUF983 domain-containing protein [Phenylobacterium sp.]|jgi:uncharacterized protein (DUF983 family)|uniref:DUF983 domain-containing protein n=1 Tax=Phenylobacterium sp. TaxID=1871053 RepID=UPI003919DEE1